MFLFFSGLIQSSDHCVHVCFYISLDCYMFFYGVVGLMSHLLSFVPLSSCRILDFMVLGYLKKKIYICFCLQVNEDLFKNLYSKS